MYKFAAALVYQSIQPVQMATGCPLCPSKQFPEHKCLGTCLLF
jgi:hypothetical protein